MAAVEITFRGTEYDLQNKSSRQVVLIGEAFLTNVGIGGGPIIPPGQPPGIWGPTDPRPTPPIHWGPGGEVGGPPVIGGGPIIPVPPETPNVPPPGSPPLIIAGTTPTHPMVPPPAVVIEYPGLGKVVVPQPTQTAAVPPK